MTTPNDATGKPPHRCLSEAEIGLLESAAGYMYPNNTAEFYAIFGKLRRWSGQSWGDVVEIEVRIHSKDLPPDAAVFGVPFKIRANVYGEWAAHRGIEDQDTIASWWSVTHMPTGRSLPQIRPTADQAKAIAATLAGRVPHLATADEVVRARHLIIPAVRLVMDAWPGERF
jgi:hypothetical protein